jgi:ZIP family zinc transporter
MAKVMAIAAFLVMLSFRPSTGGKLVVTEWKDCGDASTLAKVTNVSPREIGLGGNTEGTFFATGESKEGVTGGTFRIEYSQAGIFTGDICSPKTFDQFMGHLIWRGVKCPVAAGPVTVSIGFEFHNVPEYMVGSLTEDVKATATTDTGKQLFCVQVHQIGVAGPAFMQAGAAADRPNGGYSMNANGLFRGTSNSAPSQLAAPSFTDLDTTNETSAVAEKVNKSNLDADQKVAVANTTSAHGSLRGQASRMQASRIPVLVPAVVGPALIMLLGGLAGGYLQISSNAVCASQYFSAGMILAVCGSLATDLSEHGVAAALAVCAGFALGVAAMVFVKRIAEASEESDGTPSTARTAMKNFPWPLAFAIAIDSLMDGLLIGLVGTEKPRAAPMMASVIALEMGALGLSFSASLQKYNKRSRALCIFGMPLALVFGGIVGSVATTPLKSSPLAYTGIVAFAMAALVYLVTQELLSEAGEQAEKLGDKGGKLSYWLFIGYAFVLAIDMVLPDVSFL